MKWPSNKSWASCNTSITTIRSLYGFGAKLPPHYKGVGQCFALNGNYFQPLVTGGVEKIISLYR